MGSPTCEDLAALVLLVRKGGHRMPTVLECGGFREDSAVGNMSLVERFDGGGTGRDGAGCGRDGGMVL